MWFIGLLPRPALRHAILSPVVREHQQFRGPFILQHGSIDTWLSSRGRGQRGATNVPSCWKRGICWCGMLPEQSRFRRRNRRTAERLSANARPHRRIALPHLPTGVSNGVALFMVRDAPRVTHGIHPHVSAYHYALVLDAFCITFLRPWLCISSA